MLAGVPFQAVPGNVLNPLQQTQTQSQNQSQQQQQQQQQQQKQQQTQQQAQAQTMAALMNEGEQQRELAKAETGPKDRNSETMYAAGLEKSDSTQLVLRVAGAMAFLASLGFVRQTGKQPTKAPMRIDDKGRDFIGRESPVFRG